MRVGILRITDHLPRHQAISDRLLARFATARMHCVSFGRL
jgi:acid stress-induced BolA-like protein IbaG/YrbA